MLLAQPPPSLGSFTLGFLFFDLVGICIAASIQGRNRDFDFYQAKGLGQPGGRGPRALRATHLGKHPPCVRASK